MTEDLFSPTEIASLCQFAYSDDTFYEKLEAGVERFEDPVMDTQGFFLKWEDWLVICFRGTDLDSELAWNDIIMNARMFTPYGSSEGKGGWGFYASYSPVRRMILERAETQDNLLCCGHSLGGALAIIAAVDIAYHSKNRWEPKRSRTVQSRTIGCPRIGDKTLTGKQMELVPDSVNYVGRLDAVTIAPPWRKRPGKRFYSGWHRHSTTKYFEALLALASGASKTEPSDPKSGPGS